MTLASAPPPLKLLDTCLKPSGSIISSVMGEFSSSSSSIAMIRPGGIIEIYSIHSKASSEDEEDDDDDSNNISLKLETRIETWSILRCMTNIRLAGSKRDLLAIGSDSGCLSIMDFDTASTKKIHIPAPFGKTQIRRGVPGQYITSDPRGRAVMIASVEKRKLVYVVNRDSSNELTIASPLEAHRNRTICWGIVGIDNGYENPIFASLEMMYPELDDDEIASPSDIQQKEVAYYELDLGLNHVSRKWATNVAYSANCLAALPGGSDGPSGVLLGCEDYIEYIHENIQKRIVCLLPRRHLHPREKGVLVQTITVFRQKRSKFFALLQTELGDVFKVTFTQEDGVVTSITASLLDTLRIGNSLNVTKQGFLFVSSEFGNHELYKFERIDLEDAPTMTSTKTHKICYDSGHPIPQESEELQGNDILFLPVISEKILEHCTKFTPRKLINLKKITFLENLAPTTSVLVGELAGSEVSPQIYTLCGRAGDSSLKILRHGAAVTELAVSDLPGTPGSIFTVRGNEEDMLNDKYIVVSFADATLVLSVGETVEEVTEGGFLTQAPTLACCALRTGGGTADDNSSYGGICQVHPQGVRHIQNGRAKQWHCPGLKRIEIASANECQVLIALAGGEIIYFELDSKTGNLTEVSTREMGADVSCLDVGSIPMGRTRSMFAAVGCLDQSVRIISLMMDSLLVQRSSTALRARPHNVCLQQIFVPQPMSTANNATTPSIQPEDTILSIGLEDGSFIKSEIDSVTGTIRSSPTKRFLGARPVGTSRITVNGQSCTLLLSSRAWISRPDPTTTISSSQSAAGKYLTTPLSYTPLDHACRFSSEAVPEGIVATSGTTLRILMLEGREVDAFNTHSIPLRYTPRQMCLLEHSQLVIVEADINEHDFEEKKKMGFDSTGFEKSSSNKTASGTDNADDAMDMDEDSDDENTKKEEKKEENDDEEELDEEEKLSRTTFIRGPVPSSPGTWGSCIRLLDPSNSCKTLDLVELYNNEAALCCCSVRFHSRGNEPLLAVGTVSNMTLHPVKCQDAFIVLYRVVNGDRLQLLHRTKVEAPVLALTQFCGRLLAGVGNVLRLYEMGKKQLLRKCELRTLPTMVKTLHAAGDRAYVGDMMQSVHFIKYDVASNRLILLANDRVASRCITCQELLDKSTIAAGDKFGNIVLLRLPKGAADVGVVDISSSGTRALWEASRSGSNGGDDVIPKLEMLCHYFVGEIVTSMTRASLFAGGYEALIYVTITGRIGALLPFISSKDDMEFYQDLEHGLRELDVNRNNGPTYSRRPTGREHQAYRSYYAPVKHVIDGDLCESFVKLNVDDQKKIAEKLDRSVGDVLKKLEDTRNGLL